MLALREFMNRITEIVKSEYELTDIELNNSKSDIAVDARIMLVGALVRDGWSEGEIVKVTGWKQRRVNWLKNHFDERMKRRIFREAFERVK